MKVRKWVAAAVLAVAGPGLATAADADAAKPLAYGFATLKAAPAADARAKAVAWLKGVGKADDDALAKIWADESRSVLDRTLDSLALGSSEAAALVADLRKPDGTPPAAVPGILTDKSQDAFLRANLATAFAKAVSGKRVYEEALDALKTVKPELVVEPATFFFYKAVAEHALIQRDQAATSITRLLDDVADTPDRYRIVATLMFFDMQNWSPEEKDLSNIGRLMDNSGRRLDLARGGEKTQDIQKKIVFRLDEVIKELENQKKGNCNGGNCPNGGQPGNGNNVNPNNPAPDSTIMGGSGQGKVDEKRLRKLSEEWGKLPAAERAKAIQEITRDLPAKYKPMIEDYFKSLNKVNGFGN